MKSFKQYCSENYRAMRNPKEEKPESEMSYAEKRKKRMNDPKSCLLYTSPSPRDRPLSRMPSSA